MVDPTLTLLDPTEVRGLVLRVITDPNKEKRLGDGRTYIFVEVQRLAKERGGRVEFLTVMEAVWLLIAQGLAFLDYRQNSCANWPLLPTAAGEQAALDDGANPSDPAGYLQRLRTLTPDLSDAALMYVREALGAYNQRLYLAATVMIGVASEAVVLEAASALAQLPGTEKLKSELASRRIFKRKFEEFRKALAARGDIPVELRDGMDLFVHGVADLLRADRNDAGHPTGHQPQADDCYTALSLFPRFAKRLYALRDHFATQAN